MKDYIGICWTRPVPWVGFTALSDDIDTAARQSRTVRYQRDLIRRWVLSEGGHLQREIVFMELAADRASFEAISELQSLVEATPSEVHFVHVDFAFAGGWRRHRALTHMLENHGSVALTPDPLPIDIDPVNPGKGKVMFDPVQHFSRWNELEARHIADKDSHASEIMAFLADCPLTSWPKRAAALNEAGKRTHGGKSWSADNLRKFAQLHQR